MPSEKNAGKGGGSLPGHPLSGRRTVDRIAEAEGEVQKTDPANFAIRCKGRSQELLLPLNLPVAFQKTGLQVVFSGEVKEMGPTEFWAAPPLFLTAIREK